MAVRVVEGRVVSRRRPLAMPAVPVETAIVPAAVPGPVMVIDGRIPLVLITVRVPSGLIVVRAPLMPVNTVVGPPRMGPPSTVPLAMGVVAVPVVTGAVMVAGAVIVPVVLGAAVVAVPVEMGAEPGAGVVAVPVEMGVKGTIVGPVPVEMGVEPGAVVVAVPVEIGVEPGTAVVAVPVEMGVVAVPVVPVVAPLPVPVVPVPLVPLIVDVPVVPVWADRAPAAVRARAIRIAHSLLFMTLLLSGENASCISGGALVGGPSPRPLHQAEILQWRCHRRDPGLEAGVPRERGCRPIRRPSTSCTGCGAAGRPRRRGGACGRLRRLRSSPRTRPPGIPLRRPGCGWRCDPGTTGRG